MITRINIFFSVSFVPVVSCRYCEYICLLSCVLVLLLVLRLFLQMMLHSDVLYSHGSLCVCHPNAR